MIKLCALIGVDPTQIQYEWKPKVLCTELSEETRNDIFRQTLYKSTSVIRDEVRVTPYTESLLLSKTYFVNQEQFKIPILDDEVRKWREEWGEDSAKKLKMMAEKAMEDYEYLSQFRL
ncbi:hypothetical protein L218DRAFT_554015 [Marasmius fiardii PR-910]|nr:hypothetical protein L218DRAFT_554015 [Marasmius fiardii PR-910]